MSGFNNWLPVVEKSSWKKREVGKLDIKSERMKLKSSVWSWKVRSEAGKSGLKLESSGSDWWKFWSNFETINEVGKLPLKLERSIEVGQLHWYKKGYVWNNLLPLKRKLYYAPQNDRPKRRVFGPSEWGLNWRVKQTDENGHYGKWTTKKTKSTR